MKTWQFFLRWVRFLPAVVLLTVITRAADSHGGQDAAPTAEPPGAELRLLSVAEISEIPAPHDRLVVVARSVTDDTLHFKVFDRDVHVVVNNPETDFPEKTGEIAALKTLLAPLWEREALSDEQQDAVLAAVASITGESKQFPPELRSYGDQEMTSILAILKNRIEKQPFNLIASLLFLGAVLHTFFTHKFRHIAHVLEERHKQRIRAEGRTAEAKGYEGAQDDVSFKSSLFHFLGEVEAVFGIWVIPLFVLMVMRVGKDSAIHYLDHTVSYIEPIFVVVIMAISATRPVLNLAEAVMRKLASLGGGSTVAWWFSILTLGPLLGSFITEPGAMTICASLLAKQFYQFKPRPTFAYATLGLLFVNVSVGGTLTHFAAPPVLMVAGKWGWDIAFMLQHFGLEAASGIIVSNIIYFMVFRKEFAKLPRPAEQTTDIAADGTTAEPIPWWVTLAHLAFMGWSVANAHHTVLLIGGFLFFLAFHQATMHVQFRMDLRSPVLVGFFLAGLVTHGGLQQWWIEPVLGRLKEFPLFLGATFLTAFNDNAAITYLATLVPELTEGMKHAVVAGAVTGGGLTVIANAPNPAGQSILNRYFEDGISPLGLLLGAIVPTLVVGTMFMLMG
ncbi:MAG: putative Na+/H+ antiporter [Verrucomicrobiales bacterium]|nr:putative Na+/H+ antiporter [Verrucomicrobiales bacterium]